MSQQKPEQGTSKPVPTYDEEEKKVDPTEFVHASKADDDKKNNTENKVKDEDNYEDFEIKEFDSMEPLLSPQYPLDFLEEEVGSRQSMMTKLRVLKISYITLRDWKKSIKFIEK